jgi:hypothetical protein
MSQSDFTPPPSLGRPRRPLILWVLAVTLTAIFAWNMLQRHDQPDTPGEMQLSHLIMLGVWGGLGLVYAWMRWRPRKPYDAVAVRPKAEAFQAKRWRLLLLLAGYVGLVLTPFAAYETLRLRPDATAIDRLFDIVLFIGPCALTLGLMTSGIYSKAWGRVVDDELTASHRAQAFATGFAVALVAGAGGIAAILFQPAWAPATLPVVIGLGVAASATRFALLERAAQVAGG